MLYFLFFANIRWTLVFFLVNTGVWTKLTSMGRVPRPFCYWGITNTDLNLGQWGLQCFICSLVFLGFFCDPVEGFTTFLCALQFWIMTFIDSRESGTLRNGVVTFSRLMDVIYCFSSSFEFLSNEVQCFAVFFFLLIYVWISIQHLFNTFQTPFKHINKLERHQHKRRERNRY